MKRFAHNEPSARRVLLQTQTQVERARIAGCWRRVEAAAARREAQARSAVEVARDAAAVAATLVAWRAMVRRGRVGPMRGAFGAYALALAVGRLAGRWRSRRDEIQSSRARAGHATASRRAR